MPKRLFLLLTLIVFQALTTLAQPPASPPAPGPIGTPLPLPSLKDLPESEVFFSPGEIYSIALPKGRNTFRRLTAEETAGLAIGGQNKWVLREATININQLILQGNNTHDPSEPYASFESGIKASLIEKTGGTLVSVRPINLANYRGVETILNLPSGTKTINRTYVFEKFQFIVNAFITVPGPDSEKLILRALDSFRILSDADRAADIARRVEAAKPKDLPQSPAPSRPSSDLKDNDMKGKVKTLLIETEYPRAMVSAARSRSAEEFYGEDGNLTRATVFDYRQNPMILKAYGYIDGARVMKDGWVRYEYNPPPPIAAPLPPDAKPPDRDLRYSLKFIYRYDKENRLVEKHVYENTGELRIRVIFSYDGNKREELVLDSKGAQIDKTNETVDSKGNVIDRTRALPKHADSTYTIKYEAFDAQGNWTKRVVTGKSGNYDGTFENVSYIDYRTITYYP
jgi:hypothetical protein